MFTEFKSPKVIDNVSTRDRIKIRFGESLAPPSHWCCLVFDTKEEAQLFFRRAIVKLNEVKEIEL